MKFNTRLKELRKEYNLTQLDLAKKLNISKSNISKYESGSIEPSLEIIYEISKIFNVSTDYLFGNTNIKRIDEENNDKYIPETLAAHFDGDEFSDEDLEDIENFIEFVKQRKKGKG